MEIERHVKTEELLRSRETKAGELNKRKELCKELGLKIQEQLSESTLISPDMFCKRLSDEELKVWAFFLPTVYAGDQLKNYQYDTIPTEVLQDWKLVKDLGLFESFEIRTPELQLRQDPILIGVRQGARYLIARWGESLAPFEEIRKKVGIALQLAEERINAYLEAMKKYNNAFLWSPPLPKLRDFKLYSATFHLNKETQAALILARELR